MEGVLQGVGGVGCGVDGRDLGRLAGPLEMLLALVEDFVEEFIRRRSVGRIGWIFRIWSG